MLSKFRSIFHRERCMKKKKKRDRGPIVAKSQSLNDTDHPKLGSACNMMTSLFLYAPAPTPPPHQTRKCIECCAQCSSLLLDNSLVRVGLGFRPAGWKVDCAILETVKCIAASAFHDLGTFAWWQEPRTHLRSSLAGYWSVGPRSAARVSI